MSIVRRFQKRKIPNYQKQSKVKMNHPVSSTTPAIECSPLPVLSPQPGVAWADTMVLNPAIIKDPAGTRWHMLFRATGPWPQAQVPGKALPFPIFLGYAWSDDEGQTWTADWSKPALSPALETKRESLWIKDGRGQPTLNYSNGCIEDPRLFWLENTLWLTVACRVFPPGPYWEHTDRNLPPPEARPDWTKEAVDLGRAVSENLTVTVLYKVDLENLAAQNYEQAFSYHTHLTDPSLGDNRDAYLLPGTLKVNGESRYVLVHRPKESKSYGFQGTPDNSMLVAVSDSLFGFGIGDCQHHVLATPEFDWEGERIGGSWPPLALGDGEWFMGYHGKRDDKMGYTQSFMILKENSKDGRLEVIHRCPERLLYARQPWELPAGRLFQTPCLFTCSGILNEKELVMAYGAADERVGLARTPFLPLVNYVRRYDRSGNIPASPDVSSNRRQ
jgi:predicted GH43/DUF377 family glycosyl hydrolase